MKVTLNLNDVTYPIVGAWEPSENLTREVECGNEWSDAATGEGPFPCGKTVWIDPEWLRAYEQFWPVHRPCVFCPDCADSTGLARAIRANPATDDFE